MTNQNTMNQLERISLKEEGKRLVATPSHLIDRKEIVQALFDAYIEQRGNIKEGNDFGTLTEGELIPRQYVLQNTSKGTDIFEVYSKEGIELFRPIEGKIPAGVKTYLQYVEDTALNGSIPTE